MVDVVWCASQFEGVRIKNFAVDDCLPDERYVRAACTCALYADAARTRRLDAAKGQGATLIVIDTPLHADSAASRAVEAADLVLIPCRPGAFDLAAIKTTISLIRLYDKPAFVVFTAGPPHAPRMQPHGERRVLCACWPKFQ